MNKHFRAGDFAIRNSTGARVRVVEPMPLGLTVVYHVEECQSGDTQIVPGEDLRPDYSATVKGSV